MSSLAERLRGRSDRRPSYTEIGSDDDVELFVKGSGSGDAKSKQMEKADVKEGCCHACGERGDVISCETCTSMYHCKCLLPPLKIVPAGGWSCPECVNPLNEVDKILDCEMRPTGADEIEASKLGSKQKFVKQYLVKWKGLSYLHCTWVPEKEFTKGFQSNSHLKSKVRKFHEKMDVLNKSGDEWVAIRPEWTTVDRIIATRIVDNEREYLVKWKELPYDESYWEVESDISAFKSHIERFNEIQAKARRSSGQKHTHRDNKDLRRKRKEFVQYECTPQFLSGGTLHPYQLEGLNFLRFSWLKRTHVILADEMGLGKTIQSIAFLTSLCEDKLFPHLVIAPLSTLRNWEREFATWAPQLNVVMYVGSAQARSVIREHEFFAPAMKHKMKKRSGYGVEEKIPKRIKFDVLLTSYEMINLDTTSLKSIQWECMIVDEGHRLKNKESKLFLSLRNYLTNHRVLLTGTPLQNNLDELFMLMHFLDAGKFASLTDFQEEFEDINQEEQIARLHKMLAPHLLRRVKKDVMKDLPPKKELIIRVELSNLQKEYYKAILTRNYQILARKGGGQISLNNVVMELRKLCCHAYMLEGVEPIVADPHEGYRQLLECSGKLQLVDKLLVRLKEQGHRVLIYTQFQHMLDLLEEYLSYKGWYYERIDGTVSGVERQIRIDRFNATNSTRFCFLLSTRAGGLGINLATADTVILYDSDWNPHADLQAMARAHRLGQTNMVMIYRLVTRASIEERMMELTKKKMILEHLVVGRMKSQLLNQEELDDILRYGSRELFADEGDEARKARQIHYDDIAIEKLLDRTQILNEEAAHEDDEAEDGFLKAFKVANFEYVDEAAATIEEEAGKQSVSAKSSFEKAKYWEELLKDRYEIQQAKEESSLGKRKRNQKQMVSPEGDDQDLVDEISDDEEVDWVDNDMEAETSSPVHVPARRPHAPRKKGKVPLLEGEGKSLKVLGFNSQQRAQFLMLLMRFGFGSYDWSDFIPHMKQKTCDEINEYGFLVMNHLMEEQSDDPCFSDGVPKEGLRVVDIHVRNATMSLMREKVSVLAEDSSMPMFDMDLLCRYSSLRGQRVWTEKDDRTLLHAVLKYGYGRWQSILEDNNLFDVIRKELNISTTNEQGDACNGHAAPGHDSSSPYGFSRDAQRRMVEYVKKRVFLLEKALFAEYAKIHFGEGERQEQLQNGLAASLNNVGAADFDSMEALELLPPLRNIDIPASGGWRHGSLEVARHYNEMCRLLNECYSCIRMHHKYELDASRYSGKMNSFQDICRSLQRLMCIHENGKMGTEVDLL